MGNEANTQLKNVTNPTENQDAATKLYVDNLISTLRTDLLDSIANVNAQHAEELAELNSEIDSLGNVADSLNIVVDSLSNVIDSLNNIIENNSQLHEAVDLGLPSGTKWATTNVGANSPEELGDYFAWGETITKPDYTEANWTYTGTESVLSASNDAATAKWGEDWRMPTGAEMSELINSCTWQWTTFYGVNGYKVTGLNGKSIFLPYGSGYWSSSANTNAVSEDYKWSLGISQSEYASYDIFGYFGFAVRPVKDGNNPSAFDLPSITTNTPINITSNSAICGGAISDGGSSEVTSRGICWNTTGTTPTIADEHMEIGSGVGYFATDMTNLESSTTYYVRAYATNSSGTAYGNMVSFTTASGHEYADLGLSVKWATTNLGADTPEGVGDFYAWGETTPGTDFTQDNYTYLDNPGVLPATADAATVSWGDQWRLPTEDEIQELIRSCTWTWTTQNGASGYLVSNNGSSIFLPATGVMMNTEVQETDYLVYWTSSIDVDNTGKATLLMGYEQDKMGITLERFYGAIIRPVYGERATSEVAPNVITGTVSNVTTTSATCEGGVTFNGGAEVIEQGICWSIYRNPTIDDSHQAGSLVESTFSVDLTGLVANTTYHIRAYATNSAGTSYGSDKTFTTPSGEADGHNYVDLGLPSGLKWATCNLGAPNPEYNGIYFAWGEITAKLEYTQETYVFDGSPESLSLANDAANSMWGTNWRMPTNVELQELIDYCTWVEDSENGLPGFRVIGNGNSIFLPATGYQYSTELTSYGEAGAYWSSSIDDSETTNAMAMLCSSDVKSISGAPRYMGMVIRPVYDEDGGESGDSGDSDTHEPVDLGLPSGTKWASTNVGATSPEDYGDYYSWGETSTKDSYTESSYGYEDRPSTLPSSADAAIAKWGDEWRMPTADELQELYTIGEWSGESQNGVAGFRVTGPNGNSIFIPNAGYMGFEQFGTPYECYLWSSSYEAGQATYLRYTGEGSAVEGTSSLYYGYSVRPVYADSGESGDTGDSDLPTVRTNSVTNISNTFAEFEYTITSEGASAIIESGVCWSTSHNPTIADGNTTESAALIDTEFTTTIPTLDANTTYYVRAYATNSEGTAYGNEIEIFTPTDAIGGQYYVDLGLSGNLKWAYMNMGATVPEGYGDYYAWGETSPKPEYTSENYIYTDSPATLPASNDAAAQNWGLDWRMPTEAEMQVLIDSCTWIETTLNGVKGHKVVGPNGNFIFLPCGGNYDGSTLSDAGYAYFYFTSTCLTPGISNISVRSLIWTRSAGSINSFSSYKGLTIRAVNGIAGSGDTGDSDTHEPVDLGLPSGTKWASTNVGATNPEDYGDFYAWGETNTKDNFSEDEYVDLYPDHDDSTPITLPASNDAATAQWGSDWRMPTDAEIQELLDNCTWNWESENGVAGYRVSGNGNSIFIPAAGYRYETTTNYVGTLGYYWTSSIGIGDASGAWHMRFSNGDKDLYGNDPFVGYSIRPVYAGSGDTGDSDLPSVETKSVSNVTSTTAECTCEITSGGLSKVNISGVCWSTSQNPTTEDEHTTDGLEIEGTYTSSITGLQASTTYYVRAYATNGEGTAYGEELSFETLGEDEHQSVDLGLPSGVKWATANIGATNPEDLGNFFAWGETSTKDSFTEENYEYDESPDMLPATADVAAVLWQGDWRMPSVENFQELIDSCDWEWTTLNDVEGYKVTGPNENYIFFPGSYRYWSSNGNGSSAMYLYNKYIYSYFPYSGSLVRPVNAPLIADDSVSLNKNSIELPVGYTENIIAAIFPSNTTYNSITWSSSDETVATVSAMRNLANITAVSAGTCNIVATTEEGHTATCEVTVTTESFEPEYVDLGLSVKWATTNIGATSPEGFGNYYAWGEISPKTEYTEESYEYSDNPEILPMSADAAHISWEGDWRMPTIEELEELIDSCTWTWTTQGGIKGYKVESTNGNYIFLPAAGYYDERGYYGIDNGSYWTSSIDDDSWAWYLYYDADYHGSDNYDRYFGYPIRAVYAPDPAESGPREYVDLGLPSGTLWATTNVGAASPEKYGNYYAWGETMPKSSYTEDNYTYMDNPTTLPASADVATVKWGPEWRMPTKEELQELYEEFYWEGEQLNGVYGYRLQGLSINGGAANSIFLPAAGQIDSEANNYGSGDVVILRSSTSHEIYTDDVWGLQYDQEGNPIRNVSRYTGYSVRPVYIGNSSGGSTSATLPTLKINSLTNITSTTADCTCEIISADGYDISESGICWSYTSEPTIGDNHTTDGPTNVGTYYGVMSNLIADKTYYIRAYATNGTSVAYSNEFVLRTPTDMTDGYAYVDLGLTSGRKWAYVNVGADIPEDFGNYYAWGETEPKEEYTSDTYTYLSNPETLPASNDAASQNWEGSWRTPTKTELEELASDCTWTFTSWNGVRGYIVTGPNNNFIFLPAASYRYGTSLDDGGFSYYMSSTIYAGSTGAMWYLLFSRSQDSQSVDYGFSRNDGLVVRAVW